MRFAVLLSWRALINGKWKKCGIFIYVRLMATGGHIRASRTLLEKHPVDIADMATAELSTDRE